MFGLVDVLFYRLLLLACLVLFVSEKSCELKVVISCFFTCLHLCVCVCMCALPGVVAIKIQFNVCYLVLFVCLLAKQANIQTTPGNTH